ncbi:hypothetical protein V6N13_102339 [Hibiscus sabdariffa]
MPSSSKVWSSPPINTFAFLIIFIIPISVRVSLVGNMASKASAPVVLLLSLNLLFFTFVTSKAPPPPPPSSCNRQNLTACLPPVTLPPLPPPILPGPIRPRRSFRRMLQILD